MSHAPFFAPFLFEIPCKERPVNHEVVFACDPLLTLHARSDDGSVERGIWNLLNEVAIVLNNQALNVVFRF